MPSKRPIDPRNCPTIWFLRHGQTHWNAAHRVQGRLESDLTDLGRSHAAQQARIIQPVLKAHQPPVLVSPLRRAQQTAGIALAGYPYVTEDKMAEADAGVFQGRTLDEIAHSHPQIRAANPQALDLFCAAPEGEGFDSFQARVVALLATLEGPTVLIGHGLWGQVLRGLICGLSRAEMAALPNEQGCVYLLEGGSEEVLRAE